MRLPLLAAPDRPMKTTDWRWGGTVLGVPVRRHGNWHVRLGKGRGRVSFRTYGSGAPRWMLMLPFLTLGWWSRGKPRLDFAIFGRRVS